ncbi:MULTISPECIES: hypothetical protein [unclassified Nocardia]|uniref:hypothetical protein n=1 Tax=unclassified Nocardia TaxID=2637762 RepID=UPI001CE49748|nr:MULTISPECIES: hypothetical protein [unclassified Nocardia]
MTAAITAAETGGSLALPRPRRILLALAAIMAIGVCGAGIGAAEPGSEPPAPAPPTVTAPATPTPPPPATRWVPAPAPAPAPTPPTVPGVPAEPGATDSSSGGEVECGVRHISGCVAGAIDGFFRRIVDAGLNPLLDLLSRSLLTTPELSDLPRIGQLWDSSWQLVLAMYGVLVIVAGILLMAHETLQTRWGWRELAPRLTAGVIAGALSLTLAAQAIHLANALAAALAGNGIDTDSATGALKDMMHVGAGTTTNLFVTMMSTALLVVVAVLLITYIIRVAITVVLVVAAPLAMMCYALPGLDGVARWWWRAFGACLGIQVVQSLVLVCGLRVFLSPGGWSFFGPTKSGLVSVIVALAMALILVKIPFWLLAALKIGHGRGLVSTVARGYVISRTFGLLRASGQARRTAARATAPPAGNAPPGDPYANVRATATGQLMLPLRGVRRVPRPAAPPPPPAPAQVAGAGTGRGEQLMLPLPQFHGGVDLGPTPRLGRDGQYRLPITVARVPRPAPVPAPPVPRPAPGTRGRARQLAFDFNAAAEPDPYAGLRPLRGGQYPLPLDVRRVPAPPRAAVPPPLERSPSPAVGRQLHLPMPDLPVRRRHRRPSSGGSR